PQDTGSHDALLGVSADGPDDVGAVGDQGGPAAPLAEHWDGSAWSVVAAPAPASASDSGLAGVATVSPTDVWSVGSSSGADLATLIEHWDGATWSIVDSPTGAFLSGVTAVPGGLLWAVGKFVGFDFASHSERYRECPGA